jgi:hypothetical protein
MATLKDARGETTKINYQGKEEKEDVQEKRGWKVYEQP